MLACHNAWSINKGRFGNILTSIRYNDKFVTTTQLAETKGVVVTSFHFTCFFMNSFYWASTHHNTCTNCDW